MVPTSRFVLVFALSMFIAPSVRAEDLLLEHDVLPVLTKQCLGCRGGLRQKGGLDLRTVPAMIKGGESGPAVMSGDPKTSEIWKRIESDEMPPNEKKLTPAEKAAIKGWISAGMPTVAERQKNADPLLKAGQKHDSIEVARAIDKHIDKGLTASKLKPAGRSDDIEFLRRVFLDLTGRVPTAEQAAGFIESKDEGKRAKLIDNLLAMPQYGEQLGRTWRDWICPPELPSDANGGKQPHAEAQNLGKWLGTRFAAGDSWDVIARDVLTVEGEIKSKPQVIFFALSGEGGKATPSGSARATAALFMGVQLQCAECHDDPYRAWSQKEHWALAAYFAKTSGDFNKVSETRGGKAEVTIPKSAFKNVGTNVPAAFLGEKSLAVKGDTLRPALVE